jgi:hypothetical protein
MRLSRLLSKHIQESNSVNHFNLCATIWKVRIFERTPVIRNSGKKKRHRHGFISTGYGNTL